MRVKRYCFVLWLIFFARPVFAQQYDTLSVFSLPVQMDSFVIKSGFDVDAFIARVKNDSTFYKAFKSMRLVPYSAVNNIEILDKNGQTAASLHSKTKQVIHGGCRTTRVTEEHTTGHFYKKNGDYRYYTAKLYAFLFFAKQPKCNENDIVAGSLAVHGKGQMEKSEYELKQLIFNPGSRISGVPFMGERASIFDPAEAKKYVFKITKGAYEGRPCFIFSITPASGYEHRVIYNELVTWFRVSDYSIVARDYSLSYHTLVYDFDVRMKVRTSEVGGKLYPTRIEYDGNWHIFTRKRERAKFTMAIAY